MPAVSGDATEPAVLVQAHVARARMLVIATPDTFEARRMVETARAIRRRLTSSRARTATRKPRCSGETSAAEVFMGEHELALGMTRRVLEQLEKKTQ